MLTRSWAAVVLAVLLAACAACRKKDAAPSGQVNPAAPQPGAGASGGAPAGAKSATPFLQGTKDVPARLEWNRDFGSRKGGTVVFRVSSSAPFAVPVVTDKGYRALLGKTKVDRSELLLTVDAKPPSYEGRVTVPPGMAWFIIENQSDATAQIKLECYEGH